MVSGKYLYKVNLDTAAKVNEFVKAASKVEGSVSIVSGTKRINAKSFLGVLYAKVAWDNIYVECEKDCWWEFHSFIEE